MITIRKVTSIYHNTRLPDSLRDSIWLLGSRPPGPGGQWTHTIAICYSNSNHVIMASDWNCLKYFCVFLYCNHQVTETFDNPEYNYRYGDILFGTMGLTTAKLYSISGRDKRFFSSPKLQDSFCAPRISIFNTKRGYLSQVKSGRSVRQTILIHLGPRIISGAITSTPIHPCGFQRDYLT
jgi:hypothetical protein